MTFFISKPLTSSLYYKQENKYFQNIFFSETTNKSRSIGVKSNSELTHPAVYWWKFWNSYFNDICLDANGYKKGPKCHYFTSNQFCTFYFSALGTMPILGAPLWRLCILMAGCQCFCLLPIWYYQSNHHHFHEDFLLLTNDITITGLAGIDTQSNGDEHNTCNFAIIQLHWLRKVLRFKGWYAISAVFTQLKLRIPRPKNVQNPRFYQWYICTSYCLTFLGMRLRFTIITQNQ